MPNGFSVKSNTCPVCGLKHQASRAGDNWGLRVSCIRCGEFQISRELADDVPGEEERYPETRKILWSSFEDLSGR